MERALNEVNRSNEAAADLACWFSRPMAERIAAVEVLRQQEFGEIAPGEAELKLQGVWPVTSRQVR